MKASRLFHEIEQQVEDSILEFVRDVLAAIDNPKQYFNDAGAPKLATLLLRFSIRIDPEICILCIEILHCTF